MKTKARSRIMVGVFAVFICALWSSMAFASLYSLDGYTGTFATFDSGGNALIDTPGYYHLDLVGNSWGSPSRVNGLTGTISLYAANADGTRNTTTPTFLFNPTTLLDSFYLQYNAVSNGLDLGSTVAGTDATLLSLSLTPPPLNFTTPFDLTTNANFFINTILGDGSSFDANGNPVPATAAIYGSVLAGGFAATYIDPLDLTSTPATPNSIDMPIDDTTYSTSNPAAVPEPSTFLLIGAGLAGLGIWRRRKA